MAVSELRLGLEKASSDAHRSRGHLVEEALDPLELEAGPGLEEERRRSVGTKAVVEGAMREEQEEEQTGLRVPRANKSCCRRQGRRGHRGQSWGLEGQWANRKRTWLTLELRRCSEVSAAVADAAAER